MTPHIDDALQIVRAVNVALLTIAGVAVALRVAFSWDDLTRSRRHMILGFGLLILSGVVGSAIKYLTRAPVDPSILLVTAAALATLNGVRVSRADAF